MKFLVTGGAGFIGSAVVRHILADTTHSVVVLDKLTYAANPLTVAELEQEPRHRLVRADIADAPAVAALFTAEQPDAVIHLAAESHVDRSIDNPGEFVQTNVVGTFTLLDAAKRYWSGLDGAARAAFRFVHVSTDEVYGSLGAEGAFSEDSTYAPNSPYAASKAGSDHLARAWGVTFGLPVVITNCSNNYGPRQFPEKLIPLLIANGLAGKPLPIYGDGLNVRDWLYVEDHARALVEVATRAVPGAKYMIGGGTERTNLEIVREVCALLDQFHPDPAGPRARLITHVKDRPGHDRRYAADFSRIDRELGWQPRETLETGLARTVRWYLDNPQWCAACGDTASNRQGLSPVHAG
jgi:dTDP-glucose 4,6-dehydratase